jgi:hypothetical protein
VTRVGPVLEVGEIGGAVLDAIRELNPEVDVVDRGAYVRVLVPGRCVVTRSAIERALGRPFVLERELELAMPSFQGTFSLGSDEAVWVSGAASPTP